MTLLITGASGFVGRAVVNSLTLRGLEFTQAVRRPIPGGVMVGDIGPSTSWSQALKACTAVIHLAARVHVMNDKSSDPLAEFRRVNVEGTDALARQAAAAGVRRFIFVSSVKVNGEITLPGQAFAADDSPNPRDPYAISKLEAELRLREIAALTGMEVAIIRPPLVYGPGVKANFNSMMHWLSLGVPLPLASVNMNRRSLVSVDNLVDLILLCLRHPAAADQTFLVSDGEDLSTAQLLNRAAKAMDRSARLFPMPPAFLKLFLTLLNRPRIYQRLCDSLQLDITKTRTLLGWTPPISVDDGLRAAVRGRAHEEVV